MTITSEIEADAQRLADAIERALPDDEMALKHAWRLRFVLDIQPDGTSAPGDDRRELRLAIIETHVLRAAGYIDALMQRANARPAGRPAGVAVDEAIAQLPQPERVAA
jgi:hypothetical protein